MNFENSKFTLRAATFALLLAVALPSISLADPQGRGHDKRDKKDVFVNGHDARDGRTDGRGPKHKHKDKDDRDDDRDDRDRDRDHDRDRDRDRDGDRNRNGSYSRSEVRRVAVDNGYREGYRAGRDDRASGRSNNYRDSGTYRDASIGYRDSYGDRALYQRSFQDGFRRGYNDGYDNRSSRRGSSRVGSVLGDILNRP